MKLNYSYKKTITTADLYNACDPPLTFEVLVKPPRNWPILFAEFEDTGADNIEMAKKLLIKTFLSVSDSPSIYPLDTQDIKELQAAIEEGNIEMAKKLFNKTFLSVSDSPSIYPLDTIADIEELQAAIEANSPGYGTEFICNLVWAFGRKYYLFLRDNLGNSLKPLPQSNGSSGEKSPALAS